MPKQTSSLYCIVILKTWVYAKENIAILQRWIKG